MMKKKLLATTVLSTLLVSGGVSAAFTESTNGLFNGQIDFNGTIIDSLPTWSWEIPDQSVSDAKDWNVSVSSGVDNQGETTFTFPSKAPMTLIHGLMKKPAVMGGVGMTPVVKITGDGGTEIEISGEQSQSVNIKATGEDASAAAVADGIMSLKAQTFLGGAYKNGGTSVYFGQKKAQDILTANQTDFTTTYPNIAAATGTFAEAESDISNTSNENLSGAYLVNISDYSIQFPTASLPAKWTAELAVTVTLK